MHRAFQMGRKRWREDNLNLSVEKNAPPTPKNNLPLRSGSKTGQTELKKKIQIFLIDINDLGTPLLAKSIQNLYKPLLCDFMEKSQEYGIT